MFRAEEVTSPKALKQQVSVCKEQQGGLCGWVEARPARERAAGDEVREAVGPRCLRISS